MTFYKIMKATEYLIKFYDFLVVAAAVLAIIGGTANLFYFKLYLFGVTNLCLGGMAVPYVVKRVKNLLDLKA